VRTEEAMDEALTEPGGEGGWRTAAVLAAAAFATSIAQPSVLVAIPFLLLVGTSGIRGRGTILAVAGAMVLALSGVRDGMWFVERAWALTAGGAFVALSVAAPGWRVTSRALASIASAVAALGLFLLVRVDAWKAVDWTVSDRLRAGFTTWMDAMSILRDGQAPPPTLVSAIYRTVEAQVTVFPALLAIETMAAMAVAWWLYVRLVHRSDRALGPVSSFRFNDHLVWVMVTGLAFVAGWGGEAVTRIGANLAVFMAALYAVRGLAVGTYLSGGISFVGFTLLALGILFAGPVVVGFAVLLGVADTWLDVRARAASIAS
jgi:hypothetical protein